MKTLFLIRHAKSSWSDTTLPDIERPLNERGKYEAPLMAKRLKDKKIEIDAFVSSPAKRAKKTTEIFMDVFDAKQKKLVLVPSLYEATTEKYYDVIENLTDKYDTVAVFAHNPGITDFINSLECSPIYDMPTCAVYALKIKAKSWGGFKDDSKEFLFFDYPKNQ